MKYLSLFSGIGAFEKALNNINIDYKLEGFSEIDKYAIKSYCTIHDVDESLNLGDITQIDIEKLPTDIDLITHGSPCQDFSVAGTNKGGDEGTNTRSSLMWNTVEIVKHCKPKYVVWENVKNVLSKKHKHNFEKYINELKDIGYKSYYQVLNAKDYGVPQNRERIYCISILGDHEPFEFPEGFPLELRLRDVLEDQVEEKYYLSEEIQNRFKQTKAGGNIIGTTAPEFRSVGHKDRVYNPDGVIGTLIASDYKQPKQIIDVKPVRLGGVFDDEKSRHQAGSIWDKEGISPTLDTMQGGWRQPLITESKIEVIGKLDCEGWYNVETRVHSIEGVAPTVETRNRAKYLDSFKIRKLTPLECWRLMGFTDKDFYKAQSIPTSNTQLYKQAGNSIVVNVLEEIFKKLFNKEGNSEKILCKIDIETNTECLYCCVYCKKKCERECIFSKRKYTCDNTYK